MITDPLTAIAKVEAFRAAFSLPLEPNSTAQLIRLEICKRAEVFLRTPAFDDLWGFRLNNFAMALNGAVPPRAKHLKDEVLDLMAYSKLWDEQKK